MISQQVYFGGLPAISHYYEKAISKPYRKCSSGLGSIDY